MPTNGCFAPKAVSLKLPLAKITQIYRKTGNLRAVQLLLGHTKLESTVRYLGIEVDDALHIAEQIEL
jgi:phage tail tube protein FII